MADDNGVFFSMVGAPKNVSRLDVLRAKVRSSQQKVVASSKNIIQSQHREHMIMGYESISAAAVAAADHGQCSSIETTISASAGPLHMQKQQQHAGDDSVTQLLQEQLRLVYSDRASLKEEISTLQREFQQKEASLQYEVMTFKYKCDVLKKEAELYQNQHDENMEVRDDAPPTHRRLVSSPPKEDYFQFVFGRNDDSFLRPPSSHRRARHPLVGSFDSNSSDATTLLKLRDEVESYKAKEKKYSNEIQFLQMEIQRVQLEQELKSGRFEVELESLPSRDSTTISEEQPSVVQRQSDTRQVNPTSNQNARANDREASEPAAASVAIMKESLDKTGQELVELRDVIEQLELKNKHVETMVQKLKDESSIYEGKYMSLKSRNHELEQTIKELERGQQETEEKGSDLARKCNELEALKSVVDVRCADAEEKKKALEKEYKKLVDENQELLQIYDEIYQRSNDLLEHNEKFESRTKELENKNLELEAEQAKLEDANRVLSYEYSNLNQKLEDLPSMLDRNEVTVRIANGTTGRSSEVLVSKSHSVSLYDSLYCNPRIRAARVRTWPNEIAEKVRNKHCKIICEMVEGDGITSEVFDIEELKQITTSMLFQSFNYAQEKIEMVLRWIPLEDNHVADDHPLTTVLKGMRVTIMNGHSKCSRELYMPLSESLTIYETVYGHAGVKAVIRKWPREVVWRVTNERSRIVCRASNGDNQEFASYSIDDLKVLTLRDLHDQASIDPIELLLEEKIVVKEDELYLPFKSRGFRQRGWIPPKTRSKMAVRLKNETTQRSRDLLVPISSDLSLFDAAYNCDEVLRANVRKWKTKFVNEVKVDLSRILCVFLGDHAAEIRICSVESLKTITTSQAKKNLSNSDGSVSIVLRCTKTKKGVEAARTEEMRLRIVNHVTRRTMFLYVPYSEELSLYDSIYNKPEVKAAQVRMWPKEVLHAIKDKTATIQCHLFDGQASENELQVFSIDKLKETPTKRIFDLIPSAGDVPQLVLKYHSVGNEKSEISLRVSNDLTGRLKELQVPVSHDMTLYDVIYQSASIKFSYVRMWPSDVVQKVKNKTAEIQCVMMGNGHEITFSIEDMKKTTTTQLVELSPPPYDLIRLVLKCTETGNVTKETDNREIKELGIRITNETTARFRDLTVPISEDLSLYQSIYNNRSVKTGKVRVWPGNLVQDLKRKAMEVECAVVDAKGQIIYTYTVSGMRNTSTKDLFELVHRSDQKIHLLLRCEAKAYTGSKSSRLQEAFRPKGFRQRGWIPKSSAASSLRVRMRNEMSDRSADLLVSVSDLSSSIYNVIYDNSAIKRRNIRKWPANAAAAIKAGSSQILCLYLDTNGNPIRKLTTQELRETPVQQLLDQSSDSGRIDLSLRCVATIEVTIDADGDDARSEGSTPNEMVARDAESLSGEEERPTNIEFAVPNIQLEAESSKIETLPHDQMTKTSSCETAGLYPEELMSSGFKIIQEKTKKQTFDVGPKDMQSLGMYPEVRVSLGFKDAPSMVVVQSLGSSLGFNIVDNLVPSEIFVAHKEDLAYEVASVASEVIGQDKVEIAKRKVEKKILGIYSEVFESLGFNMMDALAPFEISVGHEEDWTDHAPPGAKEMTDEDGLETRMVVSENDVTPETKSVILESRPRFKPTGFRQRGWLPTRPAVSHFRVRLINESSGRWKDLIIPVSEIVTLFDSVYNAESVQSTNIRQFPSRIALEVKQKACEVLVDVFIPCYGPIDRSTNFFGDGDILIDDEGTAIRTFTLDDLHQTTTVEIFELMSQPKDMIKFVLRVKKVEVVDELESRVSTLEKQLRIASQQAKSGSELLADKLRALEEATNWNKQLSEELEELREGADVNANRPPSPRSDMVSRSKQQTELLEQKERALEQATERNESLKLQVVQLLKEIEILEVAANTSIMSDYKSVVDHVIEEEDDRDELSKDVSFKPVGFRQRGWRSDESAHMDMRLRVTNESTQHSKDFVIEIDDQLTVFDAVYMEGSSEDILDKTSNIQCIVWHDTGKDVRTFSLNALKQMSTKRFFELTSRRQDLMKALMRCQETAKNQVQELESDVHSIGLRNEELQNSMCVLSNELAKSMAKYNRLQRELDTLKQSQEGGLLFATDLFEI